MSKQDCEIAAGYRMLQRLRGDYPRMSATIVADSLYSKQPFVERARHASRFSRRSARSEDWLRRYLPLPEIAMITRVTADVYAEIWLELKRSGTPIPVNDAWIAALARQHHFPVLSNDSHFDAVKGVQRLAF